MSARLIRHEMAYVMIIMVWVSPHTVQDKVNSIGHQVLVVQSSGHALRLTNGKETG